MSKYTRNELNRKLKPVYLLLRENLKKAERMRTQREGDKVIIVEDETFEAEMKKREDEEIFDLDNFTSKDAYVRMLRKSREKQETEEELSKEAITEIEHRKRREYEVELAQIDVAKIIAQNINIRPVETFQHPEELFYFIQGLTVRLSDENMRACLNGFLILAEKITEADIESSTFQKFLQIVLQNLKIIGNSDMLILISKFGDLYCITNPNFWERLEQKITPLADQMVTKDLVEVLEHFSHQKEGTEYFFDKLEMTFLVRLGENEGIKWPKLTVNQLTRISLAYFSVKRGTKEFFAIVQEEIQKQIEGSQLDDLLQIALVYKNSKKKETLFQIIEKEMLKHMQTFDFQTACRAAGNFGFIVGSMEFYTQLEIIIFQHLTKYAEDLNVSDFRLIIDGFLHTYRGTKTLFKIIRPYFLKFLPQISVIEAATIIKSMHLIEFDDKEIQRAYEDMIVYHLQGINEITLPELLQITKSYTLTRVGSRKLYKLLEIVITHRLPEIEKDSNMLKELFVYYSKSGLCSEELMNLLERFELLNN